MAGYSNWRSAVAGGALMAAALGAAGCATRGTGEAEALAAFLEENKLTGDSVSCVSLTTLDRIEAVGDGALLVEMRNGDRYLNRAGRGCSLRDARTSYFQYQTSISRLCQGEIVRMFDRGTNIPTGQCGLGDFEEIARGE